MHPVMREIGDPLDLRDLKVPKEKREIAETREKKEKGDWMVAM